MPMQISDADAALLSEIDGFLRDFQMSATAFGMAAVRDPNFLFDMREKEKPRSPSGRTVAKARDYMAQRRREKADGSKHQGRETSAA